MAYTSQADIAAAFADLDGLLAARDDAKVDSTGCQHCGSHDLERVSNSGSIVDYYTCCRSCGVVQQSGFGLRAADYWSKSTSSSNYRRIHHWHERISQLCLEETQIPLEQLERIVEGVRESGHTVLTKDVIRSVLRSLGLQVYIEKWLSIIWHLTGLEPPRPGPVLLMRLDQMFQELQAPFETCRSPERRNFLNYNYVFARLFQFLGCKEYTMFFPLIKSRQKMQQLDDTWARMMQVLGWEFTTLEPSPSFAVQLPLPVRLLHAPSNSATSLPDGALKCGGQRRMVFRKSDLRLLRELSRPKGRSMLRAIRPELAEDQESLEGPPDGHLRNPKVRTKAQANRLQRCLLRRPKRVA